ncbi:formate dehydrogenase subunit delta [Sphaerotilus sulfidivorans]|nr:formate dehydrogenase subunit delta [Sphaerotilus natans]
MSPTVDTAATLVRLANRIGEFFAAFPEREEALDGIAQHLAKFWEPRMRRALYAHLDGAAQGEGLAPLVREAVLTRRGRIEPLSAAPARPAAGS